jgi:two-component system sensor histidine kinase BaeS
MRLRLIHLVALMLLATVALAVAAMGALTAWNLRSGFADYLAARENERLERFAALVAQTAAQAGGIDGLRADPQALPRLLHQFAEIEGLVPQRPAPAPPMDAPGTDPQPRADDQEPPPERRSDRPDPPPPAANPPGGPDAFGRRVWVVDLEGAPVLGRPPPRDDALPIQRPVQSNGQTIAWARMRPLPPVRDALDAHFLRRQYQGIVGVAGALVLLALGTAGWVAGRWARPLVAVQAATARIARGEFGVRLAPAGSAEIGDVVRNVNRMAEGLQRLESARRRWLADLSHELRTPLAVLRGELEALADGVRPFTPAALASLREETLRLNALVDDLHLLALSDLQSLPCHPEPGDAAALLQRVQARFAARAAGLGLGLNLDGAEGPLPAHWDEARIEQLLANLMENSLRYTDAPGRIVIGARREGALLRLRVEDSAPGVATADLPRLFEPLFRSDAARARAQGGSGLGLAICEAIALAHGGRLRARHSALGGLCIEFDLPWGPVSGPASGRAAP